MRTCVLFIRMAIPVNEEIKEFSVFSRRAQRFRADFIICPDFLTGTPKTNQTVLVNHFVPDF